MKIMEKRIKDLLIISLVIGLLSGCSVVQVVVYEKEMERLEDGVRYFKPGKYTQAEKVFLEISTSQANAQTKNAATYNLACTRIMLAKNSDQITGQMKALSKWRNYGQGMNHLESPILSAEAMKHQRNIYANELRVSQQSVQGVQKLLIEQEKVLQVLQHQISELEAIDQQLQENKKPL